ncbi:MAG: glycoside hydrolase family 15 protein [Thermoplasmata archaeon]|nr:glycoside hydrolase family 15 protein [Thermoplasmata archaeon]
MRFRGDRAAFGGPGIPPRWAHGNKEGVGTAYSADSKLWFTMWRGVVTEVYYPLIDHPQTRDLQFLVTDGRSFFHEERRHLRYSMERINDHALGYRVTTADPQGRYAIEKEVISHPHLPVLLERARIRRHHPSADDLSVYMLLSPHLDVGGWGNNGHVVRLADRDVLVAERHGTWLALGASVPLPHLSVGYVGASDGWSDIKEHLGMTWEFDRALDGNLALTGELAVAGESAFTVGLAFGRGMQSAVTALLQALATPYDHLRERYLQQWDRPCRTVLPLAEQPPERRHLYHTSFSVLLAHEDKTFPGAFIASLSIPWGYSKSDEDRGGYHLVWTRDLVQTATGLLAAGDVETPLRTLIYLAASQSPDGGFPQNFWLDAAPYWGGVQLDEVAFPILLAWRLHRARALGTFDPYPMVLAAAGFLVTHGPATEQERWEEAAGYSPSTLAVVITALIGASEFARQRDDPQTAALLESYADFLESHLESWTVTTQGTLVPAIPRHYIRIHPVDVTDPHPDEDPNAGSLRLANQAPGAPSEYPAREIVDAGFLELVRYGVRAADDPLIVDSVQVTDAVLKVETPLGPCWRRYNHDGYGQRDDGGPFAHWGVGRAWPLLVGERGHFELAAGRDVTPYLETLERFASRTGMMPEQVWDGADRPGDHLHPGRATGAAMPLMWAHAEYIKLLRSTRDGAIFDRIPEVARRYLHPHRARPSYEIWKLNRQPTSMSAQATLRVLAPEPFRLHWSDDGWRTTRDEESHPTAVGVEFIDLPPLSRPGAEYRFTFYWTAREAWEGFDYAVRAA